MIQNLRIATDDAECATTPCDSNASCSNSDGSYSCTCNTGYTGDGQICQMVAYVCGIDQEMPFFAPTDGKYTKTSDTVWTNDDGTRVITDLGYGGMEGCFAVNGIANSNCYPQHRWANIIHSLQQAESNIYSWGSYSAGSIQFTECAPGKPD